MRIRPATPADTTAITTIWQSGWHDAHHGNVPDDLTAARTPETFSSRAAERTSGTDNATTLVAEVDGAVAGFVMMVDDEVEQLYVAAPHRGRGIAAPLLDAAESTIQAAGHSRAWLAVVVGNTAARRFYARQGWLNSGPYDHHAPGGFTVPVLRYTKDLNL